MPEEANVASSAKKTDAGAGINGKSGKPRKKNLMQADVPAYTAEDARKVAEALRDQYAKQPATPVSYTHLDVYKRQVEHGTERYLLDVDGQTVDVYKRQEKNGVTSTPLAAQ